MTARACGDRVLDPGQAGHGAGALLGPFHDRGVEFVQALMGEDRPLARVEQGRILHDLDGRLDGVEAPAAFLEGRGTARRPAEALRGIGASRSAVVRGAREMARRPP